VGDYLSRRMSKVVLKRSSGASDSTKCGSTRRFVCSFSHFTSPLLLGTLIFWIMCTTPSPPAITMRTRISLLTTRTLPSGLSALLSSLMTFFTGASYMMHDPWVHVQIKRNVTSRDFIDALRRYDRRCLVLYELQDRTYASIR
jgi:hypothetical protein